MVARRRDVNSLFQARPTAAVAFCITWPLAAYLLTRSATEVTLKNSAVEQKAELVITCDACLALPETKAEIPRDKEINDAHVVRGWRNVIERTDVVHAIDAAGLIARYNLTRGGSVKCSFPDQTDHKRGRLGYPRCELTRGANARAVRIGWCCAEKYISGFEAAVAFHAEREEAARRRSFVATEPVACIQTLTKLRAQIEKHNLFALYPEAWRSALGRLSRGPARDLEYTVLGNTLERAANGNDFSMVMRPREFTYKIVGVEFFREGHTAGELDQLEDLAWKLGGLAQSRVSDAEVERLYVQAQAVRRRTRALVRWVQAGIAFVQPANREQAERAARKYLRSA